MEKRKTITAILLAVCMILQCAMPVFAEEPDTKTVTYVDENGTEQSVSAYVIPCGDKEIENYTFSAGGWYVVESGTCTISSRIINNASAENPAHLILASNCVLNAPQGISNPAGNGLVIYGNSKPGMLNIDSTPDSCAGIGGNGDSGEVNGGKLTINGGILEVKGGSLGAGIGGGSGGASGEIIINGGITTARGDINAAGIGGGQYGAGTVTINGGTVFAYGDGGAGLGGGFNGAGSVTISGGNITASSNYGHGAGIGNGGAPTTAGSVVITGGIVNSTAGDGGVVPMPGSGIGIGYGGGCSNVSITGGIVTASSINPDTGNVLTGIGASICNKGAAFTSLDNSDNTTETHLYPIENPDKTEVSINGTKINVTAHANDDLHIYSYLPETGSDAPHRVSTTRGMKCIYYDGEWKECFSVTPNNRTYDGTLQPLVATSGSITAGSPMLFGLSQASITSTDIPSAKDAGNYTVWFKVKDIEYSLPVTVKPASLEVEANDKTITYGDEPANDGVTFTGFVNGENESDLQGTLSYSYNYSQYGAAGEYTITPSGYTSTNYTISYEPGSLTVNKKEIAADDVSIDDVTATYDGDPHTAEVSLKHSDTSTLTLKYADENGSFIDGDPIDAGEYKIYLIASEGNNYKATVPNGIDTGKKVTIARKPLTNDMFNVAAKNKVCNGTTEVELTASLVGEDAVTVVISGNFADEKAGDDKTVSYTITGISGAGAENYQLNGPINGSVTANITPASASVEANGTTAFVYSGKPVEFTASASAGLLGNIDTEIKYSYVKEGSSDVISGLPVDAGTYTVTAAVDANDYHSAASVSRIVVINKMGITFTVGAAAFRYDGEPHPVAVSAIDENGEKFTGFTVTYKNDTYAESTDAPVDAGTYAVTITLDDTANLTSGLDSLELQIIQISQDTLSILGFPGTAVYGDEFTLTAEGGSGNGAVTWTSDNENVIVDAASGKVKVNGAVGEIVTLTAVKAADGNHAAISSGWSFVPSAKQVTFTLGDLTQVYDGSARTVSVTPSDASADYTVTYDENTDAPTLPGVYTVAVTAVGNYSGVKYGMLTIEEASISGVTFSQKGGVYGTAIPDAEINGAEGLTTEISYGASGSVKPVNAGKYTATLTVRSAEHETLVLTSDFTIEKAVLTAVPQNAQRYAGQENPVVSIVYSGWKYDDDESVLLGIPTPSFTADADSPAGEYEISLSRGYAENYEFSYGTAKLAVTSLPSDQPSGGGSGSGTSSEPTVEPVVQEPENSVSDCERDGSCPLSSYEDIDENAWYHDGVHYCIDNGLMTGTSDTVFKPFGTTTRAQIVTILWHLDGERYANYAMDFLDVSADKWYTEPIRWAAAEKIVSGSGNGSFRPDDPITREQMAVILWNYAKYRGIDVSTDDGTRFLSFNDSGDVSQWAMPAMMWAVDRNLMEGNGTDLKPAGDALRTQVAVIMWKFCEGIMK